MKYLCFLLAGRTTPARSQDGVAMWAAVCCFADVVSALLTSREHKACSSWQRGPQCRKSSSAIRTLAVWTSCCSLRPQTPWMLPSRRPTQGLGALGLSLPCQHTHRTPPLLPSLSSQTPYASVRWVREYDDVTKRTRISRKRGAVPTTTALECTGGMHAIPPSRPARAKNHPPSGQRCPERWADVRALDVDDADIPTCWHC